MTCERLEAILPDYFEGDLSDEVKAAADAHLKTCASCAAIVVDIDRISRGASALPAMRPARDLWNAIEERITAPVIPLAQPADRSVRRFGPAWMAVAAAALIVSTAGVTYLVTTRGTPGKPAAIAIAIPKQAVPAVDSSIAPADKPATVASTDEAPMRNNPRLAPRTSTHVASNTRERTPRVTNAGNTATNFGAMQSDVAYNHEISILERIVSSRSSGLDPVTVQVVKKNLQVIDEAIAQSKAALAKDPASALLYDQVTRAYGKKVELLRTAASLTSGT
ncbi:MAG: zf-HC2 domain-containing protein [Gemmatimonadaceae bacterium]|nr:zf-HC2 domain-containing protein [Gemmatimonadaceae bacterium]